MVKEKKEIKNQIDTKAGIAVRGAIGIDKINPLSHVADLEVDCALGNYFKITLKGDMRFDLVNLLPGSYIFILTQGGSGGHSITFSDRFKFTAGGTDLSAVAGAVDVLSCIYDGTTIYGVILRNFT